MKKLKRRNPIAFDLLTNNLYKQKVIPNKKKKIKRLNFSKIKKMAYDLSLELSKFF